MSRPIPTLLTAAALTAALLAPPVLADVDALAARVQTEDADRFVAVFEAAGGRPSATQLREGYLEPGTRAVEKARVMAPQWQPPSSMERVSMMGAISRRSSARLAAWMRSRYWARGLTWATT